MAYFLVKTNDGQHAAIVSGKCISCARGIAADNAGPEGPMVWRDPSQSSVELLRDTDAPGRVFKLKGNDDA